MTYQEQETSGAELMTNLVHIDELELTDEQLEMVAGGSDLVFWAGVGVGMAIGAAVMQGYAASH